MTTKERILKEALSLFAEKGYSAVYVGEIAKAVGIKAPSLYKHYKNKQEIFDSCVKFFSERMEKVRNELHLPDTPGASTSYETASEEQIVEFAKNLFLFYLTDEVAAMFRKMLMIERYQNPQLNQLFEDLFITGAVTYEEKIFASLIRQGVIKEGNPHIIALRFYSPIFYLLQKYDMHPENLEDALEELSSLVRVFCQTYRRNAR